MDGQVRTRMLQACYRFLVPVARFLLLNGVSFREFAELCQVAFVDVASKEFGLRGRPTNLSRVSAMTGIGRKEVARVRKLADQYHQDPRVRLSPLSDVLHYWYTSPELRTPDGNPMPLAQAGTISFETLVKKCVGDVPSGAIRAELLRHGCIAVNQEGFLEVCRREVVPSDVSEKLVTSLTFNLRALADTIAYNSDPTRSGPGRIERFVESNPVDDATRDELRSVLRGKIASFTEDLDDFLSEYESGSKDRKGRVGVGVYYFEDSD